MIQLVYLVFNGTTVYQALIFLYLSLYIGIRQLDVLHIILTTNQLYKDGKFYEDKNEYITITVSLLQKAFEQKL